ncbi:MAG: peptide-methionine (S)-S-oxide reductase MsrA [Rhodocyclaceae bacterium]|nr:peptide-methionine (S)-S-oxide reductase MsrA [Rhodocyclaceae bacterium]MBX3669924.1 peptide-methionine (S)-S-oxide reductase MsrA [Rhodocyclaceae bacterium]
MNNTARFRLMGAALAAFAANAGAADAPAGSTATAVFAGGCFWCVEADFEKLPGVLGAESGYAGGAAPNPTYEKVSAGGTGYAEAVRVTYDPAKVSYEKLLDYFWRHVDPTVKDRQFCDVGSQYRTAIFYQDDSQKAAAEASRDTILQSRRFKVIYTEIAPAGKFYPAEEYHQDYYKKNPIRYNYYRHGCGRDARVREVWGAEPH